MSARAGDHVAITPTGAVLAELAAEDVAGRRPRRRASWRAPLEPTSELDLHLGVYERYDAGAVVHTHAPMATALSCVRRRGAVRALRDAAAWAAPCRVAPYATFGTPELAASVLDALEGRTAALMANHGTLAYGRRPRRGGRRATELLEWACTVYWRAAALGTPRALDEAERAGGDRRGGRAPLRDDERRRPTR